MVDRDESLRLARDARNGGDYGTAAAIYQQLLDADSADAEVCYFLGMTHWLMDQPQQAEALIRTAFENGHEQDSAFFNHAMLLQELGQAEQAIRQYQRALQLNSQLEDAWNNLGYAFFTLGRLEEAADSFQRELTLYPANAAAHNNLGNVYKEQFRFDEAERSYREAIRLQPDYVDALSNLANVLYKMERYDHALDYVQQSLAQAPDNADAWNNLGLIQRGLGEYCQELDSFRRAMEISPGFAEAHVNYAASCLAQGLFAEGWQHYRHRLDKPGCADLFPRQPLSQNLAGTTVHIERDQGLGDELFFLRYVPVLKSRGARVQYHAGAKLQPLLSRLPAIDDLVNEETAASADYRVSVGDLPYLTGMQSQADIQPSLRLEALDKRVARMRKQLAVFGPPPYLGLTWRAGTVQRGRLYKEASLPAFTAAVKMPGVTYISLQREPMTGEIEQLAETLTAPVYNAASLNDDLEDMLALLQLLDEYVGVSNTNMHLMACLGKTARVLVPHPAEWRWFLTGNESPWFPGFRVYRQAVDGDWSGALMSLRDDLLEQFPNS